MRNKALHTIFPDSETGSSSNPIQSTLADLLPAAQNQGSEGASDASSAISRSVESIGFAPSLGTTSAVALPELLTDVSKNLDRLRAVTEAQTTETTANTAALGTNTTAKSVGQTVASVGKAAGSSLLSGLTSFPLISGLVKLFGGGSDTATPPPLPKYTTPASLTFDRALTRGGGSSQIGEPTYDQFGNPKVDSPENLDALNAAARLSFPEGASLFNQSLPATDYSALLANMQAYAAQPSSDGPADSATQSSALPLTPSSSTATTTQITVNVQAMDSRSFLDRSQDIAQAVREAMLNMHSINDVVNDL